MSSSSPARRASRSRTAPDDKDGDDSDFDKDSADDSESEAETSPKKGKQKGKGKGKGGRAKKKAKTTKTKKAAPEVEDITGDIQWLKIGDQASEIVNTTKACLWPGFVDQENGNNRLKPMTEEQMGAAVINNFFLLNIDGKVGKRNASYVAQVEAWKRTKKQGGGVEVKEASRGQIALKGYYKYVGFTYTRFKYIIHRSMQFDLSDLHLSHWDRLLTEEGVEAVVKLFPTNPNVWEIALNNAGGSMTTPSQKDLRDAADEAYQRYRDHHTLVLFLVPPRGNPQFAKVNLRTDPETWAKVALFTLLCTRGDGNDEDLGTLLRDFDNGDCVYGACFR